MLAQVSLILHIIIIKSFHCSKGNFSLTTSTKFKIMTEIVIKATLNKVFEYCRPKIKNRSSWNTYSSSENFFNLRKTYFTIIHAEKWYAHFSIN